MKKILSVSLVLAGMLTATGSYAQTPDQTAQSQNPPPLEKELSLDERFNQCIGSDHCSTQVRLQIIQKENDKMNNHFQKIHQTCADMNFQGCINKEKEDMEGWYTAQSDMQQMMRSMEAQAMNEKEPAAGGLSPSAENTTGKTLWEKMWPYNK